MSAPAPAVRWMAKLAVAVTVALAWALLNRASSFFEVRPGVAFLFPAGALTILAGAWLRWLGVAAVVVADFLLPWGAASDPLRQALFAIPSALWAAIMAVLPRGTGSTWVRVRRCLLLGVTGGSLVAALVGGALITLLQGPRGWPAFSLTATLWWISDFTAALTFGLPLLVLFVPDYLLDERDLAAWREWLRDGREIGRTASLAAAGVISLLAVSYWLGAEVHWFAVLLLPAVVMAAMGGGVAAGVVTNGVICAAYLALVLLLRSQTDGELVVVLASTHANLCLFVAFALLAGVLAARNRHLVERVRQQGEVMARGLEETVEALAATMQVKVRAGLGHVERVARLAVQIGRELGLSGEELTVLRRAAFLHDVGKIGVPEGLLNKTATLDAAERALLREHVERGVEILQRVEFLHPVMAIVRYNQERWDGSREGPFPGRHGLRGDEIPLAARVIAAAEAFDAMTHDRPYRAAMSRNAAIAEMWRCSGGQFDPAVVAALTRLIGAERDRVSDPSPPLTHPASG